VNTTMSDQLCARCNQQEAAPGNKLCVDCLAEENATQWAPARPGLVDLDELEDRPVAPPTDIVPRLLTWTVFILIACCVALIAVDKVSMPFLDNIPLVQEARDNFNSFSKWWDDGLRKLGEGIGL